MDLKGMDKEGYNYVVLDIYALYGGGIAGIDDDIWCDFYEISPGGYQ